jgi:hypothetical protein
VEVVWNEGSLLWIFGLPLDKFSTFGGFGVGGGFLATMILALAAQAAGVRSLREEALSQKGAKGVTFGCGTGSNLLTIGRRESVLLAMG